MLPEISAYLDCLKEEYEIIEDLTPQKQSGSKTYLAFFASDCCCVRVILKELDEKRTELYENLSCMWNQHLANILCIHKLPSSYGDESPVSIAAIEYAGDISIAQYVRKAGPLSENAALSVTIQLCKALSRIHSSGIVHRDIKPQNIIISDPEKLSVKLTDFGSATFHPQNPLTKKYDQPQPLYGDTTVVGTIGYQPPESLLDRSTSRSDIYSIGCVLNFMLTGADPGSARYHGKPGIRYILRRSINGDPSMRFRNVNELERACSHELCACFRDRIPVIRSVPGYRSRSRWKAVAASCYYALMAYELIVLFHDYPIHNFIITAVFWLLVPLLVIGNLGYVCEFLPSSIRLNNRLFSLLRFGTFLVCFFVPLFLY